MNKPITRIILIAAIAVLVTACGKGTSNPLAAEKPSDVLTAYYKNIEQGNIMTAIDTAYSESFKESVKANGNQGLMQAQARTLMEKIQSHGGIDHIEIVRKDNPDGTPHIDDTWTGETATEYVTLWYKTKDPRKAREWIGETHLVKENGKWGIAF